MLMIAVHIKVTVGTRDLSWQFTCQKTCEIEKSNSSPIKKTHHVMLSSQYVTKVGIQKENIY